VQITIEITSTIKPTVNQVDVNNWNS